MNEQPLKRASMSTEYLGGGKPLPGRTRQATGGKRQRGMTLIELMTVIVVVAILGSVAVASYRSYLLRANRTEARMALLRVQAAQEKFFLQNHRYANNSELTALGLAGPTPNGMYNIDLQNVTATTYTARARAAGGQLKDKADCQTLTINESGTRSPADSSGCWR